MLKQDLCNLARRLLPSPIPLELCHEDTRGERNGTSLDHALYAHLMRFDAGSSGRVRNEVNLISVAKSMDDRKRQTNLGSKGRNHDLLAIGVLHPPDAAFPLPRC